LGAVGMPPEAASAAPLPRARERAAVEAPGVRPLASSWLLPVDASSAPGVTAPVASASATATAPAIDAETFAIDASAVTAPQSAADAAAGAADDSNNPYN